MAVGMLRLTAELLPSQVTPTCFRVTSLLCLCFGPSWRKAGSRFQASRVGAEAASPAAWTLCGAAPSLGSESLPCTCLGSVSIHSLFPRNWLLRLARRALRRSQMLHQAAVSTILYSGLKSLSQRVPLLGLLLRGSPGGRTNLNSM